MSRISMTVSHVTLNGFEPGDRRPLVEGLREELLKALGNPAIRAEWAHSRRTPVLRLKPMPIEVGCSGGRKFASSVAHEIVKGLKQ